MEYQDTLTVDCVCHRCHYTTKKQVTMVELYDACSGTPAIPFNEAVQESVKNVECPECGGYTDCEDWYVELIKK